MRIPASHLLQDGSKFSMCKPFGLRVCQVAGDASSNLDLPSGREGSNLQKTFMTPVVLLAVKVDVP